MKKIAMFYRDMVFDPISKKVGSKRYMALISFHIGVVLIILNALIGTTLDYGAIGALFGMAGYTALLGKNEKKDSTPVQYYVNRKEEQEEPLEMD